ncbi:MAG: ORF6N domain-containing protein [Coxiellaceae bacterium]|nr:ORF6N domain-containing protein [Coxiellaceae bacterium]
MLDRHLSKLYEVETRVLIQSVKRNSARFPIDFMFQLTDKEYDFLISQFVISNKKSSRGGNRHAPYAFTEQGIAMLSSVLRSDRAIKVNIEIMRTFIKIRKMLVTNEKLKQQLDQLEKRYDKQFEVVFEAIRQLMEPEPTKDKKPIGFAPWPEEE